MAEIETSDKSLIINRMHFKCTNKNEEWKRNEEMNSNGKIEKNKRIKMKK